MSKIPVNVLRLVAAISCCGGGFAQTVAVTPYTSQLGVGQTLQFSATVAGTSNTAVVWSVASSGTGNGTISATGLYTAPSAVPASGGVVVKAASAANPLAKAYGYVYLLGPGPTITSVWPNPRPVGTNTVVICGTGFQSGALAVSNSGATGDVAMPTATFDAATITADGYQGAAASVTFYVKNPGSMPGNSITVPVTTSTASAGTPPACGSSPPAILVSAAPSGPQVGVGQQVQFSAKVSGTANQSVTWSVANPGPSGNGTIDATGLYTAPTAVPASGAVAVTAISAANSLAKNTVYAYILAAGPTITSVTPNPLSTGTSTVTIRGSGFKSGAGTLASWGSYSNIGWSTTFVDSTTVKANGYLGATSSVSFSVKNPGSVTGNSLVVPVTGAASSGGGGSTPPTAAKYALTVVNGTGSGSYASGTAVTITANAPPAGQVFRNWTGATVQSATSTSTTLTMPAAATTVAANYMTPAPVPYPVATHPRLWITPDDLPRLRSWATPSNPIYKNGLQVVLNNVLNAYTTQNFPGGTANPNYPDNGDTAGYGLYVTEQQGVILAFQSLIDPDPNARIRYAQYARNLLMYAMDQAALGHQSGAPFRDPAFIVGNRANGQGEQWPLIVDWIYSATDANNNPILTAADKAAIRKVFMMWANDCENAQVSGGDHPSPAGVTNSLQLLPNNKAYRIAANNFYLGHARQLTMMALAMDPADDPAVNPALPAAALGNSLRSYINHANGAWLYQQFAMFGDPETVASAYGISGNGAGLGLASGGLPPEGALYGASYSTMLGQLLSLQTAGFNDPALSGPQIRLIGAPLWDRFVKGYLSQLTPAAKVFPSIAWAGPLYQMTPYGEFLRFYVTNADIRTFALLALLEQKNGQTAHTDAARWFTSKVAQGGSDPLWFYRRMISPYSFTETILYFLLFDPAAPTATDPRPSFPKLFHDPPAGRLVAHSDWGPNGTLFDYRASWISIDHQNGDAGQFQLFRNGEWLTKEMSGYETNTEALRSSIFHNTLSLEHTCPAGKPNLRWWEDHSWSTGGQIMNAGSAGDPVTVTSSGPGYVYVSSDLTSLYNRPNVWSSDVSSTNTTLATRSLVWLNNDYIVVYDRASSTSSGTFKRFSLTLMTDPAITGNTAVETLASGQKLFVQTLLPLNASVTSYYPSQYLPYRAELEESQYILMVEDPAKPADTRFLHVLQGAGAETQMAAATRVQSTGGTPFDGAVFGLTAVYFPVLATNPSVSTQLPLPAGVNTVLVTGLAPNATYAVTNGSGSIAITPGAGTAADAAGVLRLTF
jgi:hypothetical protein